MHSAGAVRQCQLWRSTHEESLPISLVFVQQPTGATAGVPFVQQPIIEIRGGGGQLVTDAISISVTLIPTTSGVALSGTTVMTASAGRASFADLAVSAAGSDYKLVATGAGIQSATSATFDVSELPPGMSELSFARQPSGATAGETFAQQPIIHVRDGAGQLVAGPVTISLQVAPNSAGATLSGTTVVSAVGGIATFNDLAIDVAGPGYQLTATGPDAQFATSAAFDVAPVPSTITAPVSRLLVGDTVTVTLHARDAAGNPLTTGGWTVTFSLGQPAAGSFGSTLDRGDGTYTALFTATGATASAPIHATIDGAPLQSQSPTLSVLALAAVSAGQQHTCGVTTTGEALCWGSNSSGQLAALPTSSSKPLPISGAVTWAGIHAGHRNTCGRSVTGKAYCWGNNEYSQVGNGTWSVRQDTPAAVAGGLAVRRVDVSLGSTTGSVTSNQGFVNCALTTSARVYCWGDGRFGQIGNGRTDEQAVPVLLSASSFGSAAAGAAHSCAIDISGRAFCWGVNANGQLGTGSTALTELCDGLVCSTTPRPVSTSLVFVPGSLTVGTYHSCAISNGQAFCWGANGAGAIGDGSTTGRTTPVAVAGGIEFSALSAGDAFSCGLGSSGTGYCWGRALGGGTASPQLVPAPVEGGISFTQIDAGGSHACGITNEGAGYCWGLNASGQLGNGTITSSSHPVRVTLR